MPLDATYLFAAALFLIGAGLVVWNLKVYRAASAGASEDERDFLRRQLRRRLQASTMMLLLGPAILGGDLIKSSLSGMFYWGLVLLIVFWMGVLALADILATQYHYGRLRDSQALELARMKADLENNASRSAEKEKRPSP